MTRKELLKELIESWHGKFYVWVDLSSGGRPGGGEWIQVEISKETALELNEKACIYPWREGSEMSFSGDIDSCDDDFFYEFIGEEDDE